MLNRLIGKPEKEKGKGRQRSTKSTEIQDSSFSEEQREAKKAEFLRILRVVGFVSRATEIIGVDRTTPYLWKKDDPSFREAWIEAKSQAKKDRIEILEEAAFERAVSKSDYLAKFLLQSEDPDKYRERKEIEHKGSLLIWDRQLPTESSS